VKLQGKKVLVTGAGGFIGSHLTEELVKMGAQVKAFVHYNSRNEWGMIEYVDKEIKNEVEVYMGDIIEFQSVKNAVKNSEIVFHLAALIGIPYSYISPASYVATNVVGTLNVLQACREEEVEKIVHTSTSETYGTAQYVPIDEKHPLQGQSPYSASKIGGDKIAESFYLSFELPVTTLRPFNTFGPRQSARAVIPTIITQALNSDTIKLGSLTPVRDLLYVKDTVNGFVKAAMEDETIGEVINVGRGEGITIGDLAQKIFRLLEKEVKIDQDNQRVRPEKSEVMKLICNYDKAKSLMAWKPGFDFDDSLNSVIEFIKENYNLYKSEIYTV